MNVVHAIENDIIKDDDNQLADEITLLAGQLNAGECLFLKLIGEFDLRLGWAGAGIKSCAHWLNWKCGISMGTAREKIRAARALTVLPEINDAFEKGELSYSKVRAMTRVATPENENYLMMIAKYGTAQHMEKLVKQYKRVKHLIDIEELDREERDQRAVREVFYFQEDDGMWNITARLPAEESGLLIKAMNAIVDQLRASKDSAVVKAASKSKPSQHMSSKKLKEDVPAETLFHDDTTPESEAAIEIQSHIDSKQNINVTMRAGEEKDVPAETEPLIKPEPLIQEEPLIKEERPTLGQSRADALCAMAEHILAGGNSDGAGKETESEKINLKALKGADRCQLILHVKSGFNSSSEASREPVGQYAGAVSGAGTGAGACGCGCDSEEQEMDALIHLDGQWLPPYSAKRLACDASFLLVEEDDAGNVLDIGRRSRVIPPAISRALAIRDGGCQFPGCCESHCVEGHHIIHWANGGETKMENLVTLCHSRYREHHQELHNGSFFLTLVPPTPITKTCAKQKVQSFADRLVFTSGADGYVIPRNPVNFTSSDYDFSVLQDSLPDDINAQTAVCHWTGERMDYGMGIDALLWEDRKRM